MIWPFRRRAKSAPASPASAAPPEAGDLRAIREIECSIVGAGGERAPAVLRTGTPVLHVAPLVSAGEVVFTTFSAPVEGLGWRTCMVDGELVGVAEGGSDCVPIAIPPDYLEAEVGER